MVVLCLWVVMCHVRLLGWGISRLTCMITGQDGILKVSKGALVVMKVEEVGNLYRLKGSTQVSEAVVASE